MNRLVRMAISAWANYRFFKANPELKELARKLEAARRKHGRTREIERRMNEITLHNLRMK